MVCYRLVLVRDASQWAEHAVRACQPALIQSSNWPHVGLYGAQKWSLTAQLVKKMSVMRLVLLSIAFVWLAEQPVSSR